MKVEVGDKFIWYRIDGSIYKEFTITKIVKNRFGDEYWNDCWEDRPTRFLKDEFEMYLKTREIIPATKLHKALR